MQMLLAKPSSGNSLLVRRGEHAVEKDAVVGKLMGSTGGIQLACENI
jgi:hypothetical protein